MSLAVAHIARTSAPASKAASTKGGGDAARARVRRAPSDLAMQGGARLRLAPAVQAELEVNQPGDAYEQEAEAMAARVMRAPASLAEAERDESCPACAQNPRSIQRDGEGVPRVSASTAALIRNPGAGSPLAPAMQSRIAPHLGADLSGVRVHTDAAAGQAASSLDARAFTYRNHIFLAKNQSQNNLGLMAHEATHVAQQGAAPIQRMSAEEETQVQRATTTEEEESSQYAVASAQAATIQRAPDAEGGGFFSTVSNLAGAVAGKVSDVAGDVFWGLVNRLAPGLAPTLRAIASKGIVGYLKDMVLEGVRLQFQVYGIDPKLLDEAVALFGELVDAAPGIVAALKQNDCKPLFDALGRFGDLVQRMAVSAWDTLVARLTPIGDYLSNLWTRFGAPAVDWLSEKAGAIWQGIQTLGAKLWSLTEPIRQAGADAWSWVKRQLGVGEGADDESGLVGWVKSKLGAAWDWAKVQLEPLIEPLRGLVGSIREFLPLNEIMNLRDTVRGWLADAKKLLQNMSKPDDVVNNQATLRDEILPAIQASIQRMAGRLVAAGDWVAGKINALYERASGFIDTLSANPVVGMMSGALAWVREKAAALNLWAQEKVKGLFAMVSNGLASLAGFLQPVFDTLQKLVSVVSDLAAELPGLVLGPVWNAIPACIRNPIKDFIVKQILERIPFFKKLKQVEDLWGKFSQMALTVLKKIFVQGDILGAAWTVFQFVLDVLQIPAKLVTGILNKAITALDTILEDPLGFLKNVLLTIKAGFSKFFDNIWTHLLSGVTNWLFGQVREAGLKPPKDFSLQSILGFVLQVLDITAERIFTRLEKKIGAKAVEKLREALDIAVGVWEWVKVLIDEGPAGLWKHVQERLSNLWDMALDAVMDWIVSAIIDKVTKKLLSMLDPTGVMAVVNSLIAVYNAIESVAKYLRQMLEIVNSVLDTILDIATGNIEPAAIKMEAALDAALPVAIGFLANQVGLDNLGDSIREMVEGIRNKVDEAIDWLIDKAIALGKAILGALGLGKKEEPEKEDAAGKAEVKRNFTMEAEGHTLTARFKNSTFAYTMASGTERSLTQVVNDALKEIEKIPNYVFREAGQNKDEAFGKLIEVRDLASPKETAEDWKIQIKGANEAKNPEDFLAQRVDKAVNILIELSQKFDIAALEGFRGAVPPRRYLPTEYRSGEWIRAQMYERLGSWDTKRAEVMSEQLPQIRAEVEAARAAKGEGPWNKLKEAYKVPEFAQKDTFGPQNVTSSIMEVDHIIPLAYHWEKSQGNNTNDDAREKVAFDESNLRVITAEENSRRQALGAHYIPYVGVEFESAISTKYTIQGKPFLKEDGKPVAVSV